MAYGYTMSLIYHTKLTSTFYQTVNGLINNIEDFVYQCDIYFNWQMYFNRLNLYR